MPRAFVLTRGRLASLLSLVGIGGLITGLIGMVWRSGNSAPYAVVALIVGALGIVGWAALTPREFLDTITGRRMRFGTVTMLSAALLTGIVTLSYLLLADAALTLDMTQNQSFSLTRESVDLLQRIDRPIQLTGFYTRRSLRAREVDDQFFRLYTDRSGGLIRRVYIDPEENPAMADRFGVASDGALFISYLTDTGDVDFSTLAFVPRGTSQERDVTGAIARLLLAGSIKVYFETGNGERSALSDEQDGISGINSGVRESGLLTAPLDLAALAQARMSIPADAAAIILARPLRDLTQAEIDVLDRYLSSGGSLLLLVDPLFTDDAFMRQDGDFNRYLWEHYGLRALDAVVVDPDASGDSPLDIISAAVFTENDIARRIAPDGTTPTLFRLARAIEVDLENTPQGVANGRLIMTTPSGYGETNFPALRDTNIFGYDSGQDLSGPLTTAAWASNLDNGSRIVLIGDSDFVSNGQVTFGGNGILFTDALAWLSRFGEKIQFSPQAYTANLPIVYLSQQQLDFVVFLTVLVLPGAVLVGGLAVWARRVRR